MQALTTEATGRSTTTAQLVELRSLRISARTGFISDLPTVQAYGQKPLPEDDPQAIAWVQHAVVALSDVNLYPAAFTLELKDFTHVQASVMQVARAPGQAVVYLGCLLLIAGIFGMLYVRDRRLWIWLAPAASGPGAQAVAAFSSNRKTLDADREFAQIKARLLQLPASSCAMQPTTTLS